MASDKTKVVIIIAVPVAVCIILAACAAIFLRKRVRQRPRRIRETATDEVRAVESLQYDFHKIKLATNDFSDANKLEQGGFGTVYKGKLETDEEIAAKRLSANDSRKGNSEFKKEVVLVAKLQHRNLVRLLGFAIGETERVLIYELVQNASLDQFIFGNILHIFNEHQLIRPFPVGGKYGAKLKFGDFCALMESKSDGNLAHVNNPAGRSILDWNRRYKIIGGIAQGLLYLHEDFELKIVHRNLRASTILLDRDMNPKIAGSGMARLSGQDETQGNTNNIVGTHGYMLPEYAMHEHFSVKSDVFSFGVLVLEIISGQRNSYIQNGENVDLLASTWKNWQEGTASNMIDPVLCTSLLREILRCIHIGLLCVQENAVDRPTMATVALMLSTSTITLPVPFEPASRVNR